MHQQAPCTNDGTVAVCLSCTKTSKSHTFISMLYLCSKYLYIFEDWREPLSTPSSWQFVFKGLIHWTSNYFSSDSRKTDNNDIYTVVPPTHKITHSITWQSKKYQCLSISSSPQNHGCHFFLSQENMHGNLYNTLKVPQQMCALITLWKLLTKCQALHLSS